MKTFWTVIISVILTAGIVGGGVWYFLDQQATTDKNNLNSQISDLQTQISNLKKTTTTTTTTSTNTTSTPASPDTSTAPADISWEPCSNARYGYSLECPTNFVAGTEPANGDGLSWASTDKSISIKYWGSNNVTNDTVSSALAATKQNYESVTYETQGTAWYIVSGTDKGNILYQKTFIGSGSENNFVVTYSTAQKTLGDEIVNHIATVFKSGDLTKSY